MMKTIEQKAKAFDEALERAKSVIEQNPLMEYLKKGIEYIFPVLKESEEEKIRKEIISALKFANHKGVYDKHIAWLEKQGSEPNWCHHKVDLSDYSEEYRKAYYDGWNNCNMQHSQCELEKSDVLKCLINGMKFYYENNKETTWGTEKFSMKVKDILSWLEKQGDTNETINRDEFAQGVLRGAAINLITWIDYNAAEGNACLSNMECKDIEDALVSSDWNKIYAYMKKKLEKQDKSKFEQCFQEGDKIVTNEDGTHFNTSQLERVAKKEPKFKVGDTIIKKHNSDINDFGQFTITDITGGKYWYNDRIICNITEQDEWEFYETVRQNPDWSEKDEKAIGIIKLAIKYPYDMEGKWDRKFALDWLKSLKDRYTWKPSEEQMKALHDLNITGNISYSGQGQKLIDLYNDLRKLK